MPPLTLHVLPPAFALPSISSSCITAIALMRYTQQYGTWIVVADAAEYPSLVAPFIVPAYHHAEPLPEPLEGLDAIIHHLSIGYGATTLEGNLTISQRNQALALSSHLQLRLQPLISLSLYACSDNYSSGTRPSLAAVLPFPESWTLPHHLHNQALESCAQLGIDAKDLALLSNESIKDNNTSLATAGPITGDDANTGIRPDEKLNPSIARKLKLQDRIDDLVKAALAPFVSALSLSHSSHDRHTHSSSDKEYSTKTKVRWLYSSSTPTIADLMALALLSLAVLPYSSNSRASVIRDPFFTIPFLHTSIHRQYPDLISAYVLPGLEDAFDGRTSQEKALFSAPLAATAVEEGEEDGGAHEDATQGYGNLDIGSGRVEIPWRRKPSGTGWESAQRISNAVGAACRGAIGLR